MYRDVAKRSLTAGGQGSVGEKAAADAAGSLGLGQRLVRCVADQDVPEAALVVLAPTDIPGIARTEVSGQVLAYTGDSGPSPLLAELARGADLFVCEAPTCVVVDGLNGLGIGPRDLIGILQAIKAAGAIQADIEVM